MLWNWFLITGWTWRHITFTLMLFSMLQSGGYESTVSYIVIISCFLWLLVDLCVLNVFCIYCKALCNQLEHTVTQINAVFLTERSFSEESFSYFVRKCVNTTWIHLLYSHSSVAVSSTSPSPPLRRDFHIIPDTFLISGLTDHFTSFWFCKGSKLLSQLSPLHPTLCPPTSFLSLTRRHNNIFCPHLPRPSSYSQYEGILIRGVSLFAKTHHISNWLWSIKGNLDVINQNIFFHVNPVQFYKWGPWSWSSCEDVL